MKKQAGFTLIELIVVIVILGVLAATALPRFINLGADARLASVQGVAGAIASGSSLNVANRSIVATRGVAVTGASTGICNGAATIWGTLMQGGFPTGTHTLAAVDSAATCTTGTTVQCTVGLTGGATETAVATIACID